jgi:glucose-6-phosphate 1-dehydrogenase
MRANFYDSTGAILDMLVTHLFQLVGEVSMRTPRSLDAEHFAEAREEVIGCFRSLSYDDVVVGQYEGYRDIEGVPDGSRTETFVAARLWLDNERWEGVPFLLRTGKCLAESHQRVSIRFNRPAELMPGLPCDCNILSFELSGEGEIALSLVTKKPGPTMELASASAVLPLGSAFGSTPLPAYARLIHDVLLGDRSLFTRPDGLRHVWEVAEALLRDKPEPVMYPRGSWGPEEARTLAGGSGWILGQP